MSSRNTDKNKEVLKELEKTISPVLVVNNSSLKPYVELFEYAPENIYQQPLGSLVGFFEVKDFSDESAYIVNHLTAVLKKEYYINPKRPVTESLDSALHKVNIALSEIARIGNVEWLGKINAAICVLEKNNTHFSVSGNAKIFLHRSKILSEISEGLASDSLEPHPLKTFINVSSGRLEKNDRLLITSEDIFHILPMTEIDKNFQRFEGEKFVQFLKTALSNQMEMLASIVVEVKEPEPTIVKKTSQQKKPSLTTNVFSEKTFANSKSQETLSDAYHIDEAKEQSDDLNYTDKKTGHIYIQGEANDNEKNANSQIHMYQDLAKEKITQGIFLAKNELRKRFSLYKKQLAKKRVLRLAEKEKQVQLAVEESKRLTEQRVLEEIEEQQRISQEQEFEKDRIEKERIVLQEQLKSELIQQEKEAEVAEVTEKIKNDSSKDHELSFLEKLQRAKLEQQNNTIIDLKDFHENSNSKNTENESLEEFENITELKIPSEPAEKPLNSKLKIIKSSILTIFRKTSPTLKKASEALLISTKKLSVKISTLSSLLILKTRSQKITEVLKKTQLLPHFSKIKKIFAQFSRRQKNYTLLALIAIFIVPFFIVHFLNKPKTPTITDIEVIPITQIKILAGEKNINFNIEVKNIFSNQSIITSLIANDLPIAITKASIAVIKNGQAKEFPLPSDSGAPIKATYMNDLSLIFIITDANKIISFSPVSEKFTQSNNINLSNISQTSFIGTYLTYLYVLDPKANQIYRFPRAEGGFGEKTEWLKDSTSLTRATDMTIDDNIYAVVNNKVLKFFKGKTAPFELEASNTPVVFNKIYTTPDLQSFYALDAQNSRIVQYSKDGSILAQFFNDTLKDASSLSVDEKNKVAYLATPSGLLSLLLQ